MNLFILRHASAGSIRTNPILDLKRPLDKDGKKHCLQLAHVLNAQRFTFDLVVSSPLKRALQTAQLVATETGYENQILLSDALKPEATLDAFLRLLHVHREGENVLVVGHNPNLQGFLGALLVGRPASPSEKNAAAESYTAGVRLRKGSLARLSMSRGPAMLQSLLDPRTVRSLYATSTKSSRRKTSRK